VFTVGNGLRRNLLSGNGSGLIEQVRRKGIEMFAFHSDTPLQNIDIWFIISVSFVCPRVVLPSFTRGLFYLLAPPAARLVKTPVVVISGKMQNGRDDDAD
jgi:hypothetical protein